MTSTESMSAGRTSEIMQRYMESDHGIEEMAEDVVFRVMATGDEYRGREAVHGMFEHFYHGGAFEAEVQQRNLIADEGRAAVEFDFVGRHVGEFAGVPATGKDVRVPVAVCYDLRDGEIVEGRVYFEVPVFLAQVGALG